jgi:NAD(P)-dependent dehydrogenase (short-subunit alcohol dehydrogenase family)
MALTTLITGASRGLGLEFARQYADAGWQVYAGCRAPEKAVALNELAEASSGRIQVLPLDVTLRPQIKAARDVIGATPLDLLLNNAGIDLQQGVHFRDIDDDKWLEMLRVNLIAPMRLMEIFLDAVSASERKCMAALSSKMGSIADNVSGGCYPYRSSKAALNASLKSTALELRSKGIVCLILHPGWVATDMGGNRAPLSVEESVRGMREVIDKAKLEVSGKFLDYRGEEIPW